MLEAATTNATSGEVFNSNAASCMHKVLSKLEVDFCGNNYYWLCQLIFNTPCDMRLLWHHTPQGSIQAVGAWGRTGGGGGGELPTKKKKRKTFKLPP